MKNKKMKKNIILIAVALIAVAFTTEESKLISKTGHMNFYSHTDVEDISADNYKVVSALTPSTGDVVVSVPMQAFEFEKALMQKHYNSPKFLDTKQFPKAKFVGKITNLSAVNFDANGTYDATVTGDLTLHGVTKNTTEKATITVADGSISVLLKLDILLADYKVAFEKGKPSSNIAKTVAATFKTKFTKE
ncbi:MAG: polyisoprenoid-binding protein YceI [Bacteroidia bacterium]|jgi:polyisoprenoid-binding protein YceI